MNKEQLLAEIEDVLRNRPSQDMFDSTSAESLAWIGRAAAVLLRWNPAASIALVTIKSDLHSVNTFSNLLGLRRIIALLHEGQADLRMDVGPIAVLTGTGMVFDYFDQIRSVMKLATSDLFFVDRYLTPEFVTRFLPHVPTGVPVRLLCREKTTELVSSVEMFAQQNGTRIMVRKSNDIHERYMFVDQKDCYLSGASFKDGPRMGPATIQQIISIGPQLLAAHEALWATAIVKFG